MNNGGIFLLIMLRLQINPCKAKQEQYMVVKNNQNFGLGPDRLSNTGKPFAIAYSVFDNHKVAMQAYGELGLQPTLELALRTLSQN